MNGTALKWYSFLIGVVIDRQANQSWIYRRKGHDPHAASI